MNKDSNTGKSRFIEGKIQDVCLAGDGAHASLKREEDGILYLTSKNFHESGLDLNDVDYISETTYEKYFKESSIALTKPSKNDVLFSIIGTIGYPYLKKDNNPVGISSSVAILRPDGSSIIPEYLFYWLKSPTFQNAIYSVKGGVAQSYISLQMINSLPIHYPSKRVQGKIANYLLLLDNLINNNRQRIEILEEMAHLLYREWFVEFRFPGYEKHNFVDSELGKNPEGWEMKRVGDIAEYFRGNAYSSDSLVESNGIPFLNLKSIQVGGGYREDGLKGFIGKYKETHKAIKGDIIIAVTEVSPAREIIARAGQVPTLHKDFGVFSMDLVKVIAKNKAHQQFLYRLLRSYEYSELIKMYANGANVLHLNPEKIMSYEFLSPTAELIEHFCEIDKEVFELKDNLMRQNQILIEARDLLLPKLVSGEIDVSTLDINITVN